MTIPVKLVVAVGGRLPEEEMVNEGLNINMLLTGPMVGHYTLAGLTNKGHGFSRYKQERLNPCEEMRRRWEDPKLRPALIAELTSVQPHEMLQRAVSRILTETACRPADAAPKDPYTLSVEERYGLPVRAQLVLRILDFDDTIYAHLSDNKNFSVAVNNTARGIREGVDEAGPNLAMECVVLLVPSGEEAKWQPFANELGHHLAS